MSIKVDFYQFKKRVNSTIQPNQSPIPNLTPVASYDCILKAGCGIMSPVISLDYGISSNPTGMNYAYIADFGRYYYVKEWQWDERLWHIYLEEDVLASFKTDILNSNAFVLRSAGSYDTYITDDFYPTKAEAVLRVSQASSNPWPADLSNGYYIVGIINDGTHGVGAVTYYSMTQTQFNGLKNYLLSDTSWLNVPNDFLNGGMDPELLKTLFNPFQYIASVKWIPVQPPTVGPAVTPHFGWWGAATGVQAKIIDSDAVASTTFTIDIPDHPQAASRGEYLNAAPYTKLTLYAGPFGEIPLDGTVFKRTNSVICDIAIDCVSGVGVMQIQKDPISAYPNNIVKTVECQIAIDIQMAEIGVDKLNQQETIIAGEMDVTAGVLQTAATATNVTALTNPLAGALSAGAQGAQTASAYVHSVANGIRASLPQMVTSGGNGSLASFYMRPYVLAECYELVTEDLSDFGRPLVQNKALSTLFGFTVCKDPHVMTYGTVNENAAINAYLESGFFIE